MQSSVKSSNLANYKKTVTYDYYYSSRDEVFRGGVLEKTGTRTHLSPTVKVVYEICPEDVSFNRKRSIPTDEYMYKYKSLGSKFRFENYCVTLKDINTNQFVGFCGAAPVRVLNDSNEQLAYWTCDLFVVPEYRGIGLGNKLYEAVEKDQPLLLGFGTSDRAYPIKVNRGWKTHQNVHEYFYRQRATNFKQWIRKILCNIERVMNKTVKVDTLSFELVSTIDRESLQALWELSKKDYPNIAIRDASYMAWRYLDSPAKEKYRYLIARDSVNDRCLAVLVVRPDKSVLKIVDYVGPKHNPEVKSGLLQEIFSEFSDLHLIHCVSSCPSWAQSLRTAGFYKYKKAPRFTVRDLTGDKDTTSAWFVMLGDSDGEHIAAMESVHRI